MVNLASAMMCEDCGFKHASFGAATDRYMRWCGSCVKANGHKEGTVYLMASGRMCEDCHNKIAAWGVSGEKKRRWCGGCVKAQGHTQAVILGAKMCEDCGLKNAGFGHESDRKKRWCGGCAKTNGHVGAVNVTRRSLCEDCVAPKKSASYGMETDPEMKRRWCSGCAAADPGHPGAVSMVGKKRKAAAQPLTVVSQPRMAPSMAGSAVAAQPVRTVAAQGVPPPHPHHRAGAGIVGLHHQVAAPRPPSATALRGQHPLPPATRHHPAHAVFHTPVEPVSAPLMSPQGPPPGAGHINAVRQVQQMHGVQQVQQVVHAPPPISAAAAIHQPPPQFDPPNWNTHAHHDATSIHQAQPSMQAQLGGQPIRVASFAAHATQASALPNAIPTAMQMGPAPTPTPAAPVHRLPPGLPSAAAVGLAPTMATPMPSNLTEATAVRPTATSALPPAAPLAHPPMAAQPPPQPPPG